jgi:arylsulfatase A-like enzyme
MNQLPGGLRDAIDVPTRLERLGVASAAVLGWLPIAAFWLYSKQIRVHDKYFPLISSYSGIEGQGSWLDRLALLRPDLLWSLVLLPSAIFLAHYAAPRSRANRWFWILLSLAVAVLLFANLHSWGTIGRFLTGTAAVSAFSFAIEQPQMIPQYIGLRGLSKLIVILVLSVICYAGLTRAWRCRWCVALSSAGVLAVSAAALGLWGATALSAMRALPVSRDFVWQSMEALLDVRQHTATDEAVGAGDLRARFATLTRTPPPLPSAYHGTSRGNDLLVFVLETGSKRFLDPEADLDGFPTLKQLATHSAIASAHHSVFPATAEAMFSLYTSTYPARTLYGTCVVDPNAGISRPWDGFMSALKGQGYFTGAYLPFTSVVPLDKSLLGHLGLEKLYYAQEHTSRAVGRDRMALDEVKADIEQLISQDRRYAMVFLPQLGHAPWPERPTSGKNMPAFGKVLADASVRAYGRMLAQVQDEWLGQVVKILADKGRLDKTTIVVTGDHGIRTTAEDPDFKSGLIDRYSFEVPLLIHSASSFNATTFVRKRTSHIDVSPTLLDLYGIDPIESQQGISIFQPENNTRRLFFDANWYFGADGYADAADDYLMYSEVLGLAFRSKQLEFSANQVLQSSQDTAEVERVTTGLYNLQERWIRKYLCR